MKTNNKAVIITVGIPVITTILSATILSSTYVSADNDSVVDQINITVPVSCTMTGTGMDSHNANINNGLYVPDIGSTTLHAFCNDNEGFAIYAAGYTGNEIGGTNSNKLIGTNASSNAAIVSGIATTAGDPDLSNWAMKLAISQDSGDTTSTNAFTIDSAPNVDLPSEAEQSATQASFSEYHVVPNEYTKVVHKNSMTDMTATTGGVKLTTTYAAYISKTQPADTYSGQVIYALVHPASAAAPVGAGKVGVTYHANGSTFTGGGTTNNVVYANSPMYIATTPLIAKTSNIDSEGNQSGAYPIGTTLTPITATGADKMKVVIRYGLSSSTGLPIIEGEYNGQGAPAGSYEVLQGPATGTATYTFNGDAVTFYMVANSAPIATDGQDYGYFAEVYPVYTTEPAGTVASDEFATFVASTGTYATTTDWYGSWYGDINGEHYDFMNEAEVISFLSENMSTLSGTTIDLYRGLTFTEAYTRANKSQDGGYYKQQELTKSMCNTIAITQNQTLKDVRDNNTYMIGKLKDGNCWMLDNLALNPTDAATAQNMNEDNTNATTEAIANYLNGGSVKTGWSNWEVRDVTYLDSDLYPLYFNKPYINSQSKDVLVTSYGPTSVDGQAKVGIYYNYCAATVGTYCYDMDYSGPFETNPEAFQDVCPANWRMPIDEYYALSQEYGSDAARVDSLQYNLSTPLSGGFYYWSGTYDQNSTGYWWSSSSPVSSVSPGPGVMKVTSETVEIPPFGSRSSVYNVRCLVAK